MEAGKDSAKSHSWVDGAEVEADRWVDTADPAALDAWGRDPSPEPASRGTADQQAPGEPAQKLLQHDVVAHLAAKVLLIGEKE